MKIKEKFQSKNYINALLLCMCFVFLVNSTALAGESKTFSQGSADTNKTQWTVKFKGEYYKGSINSKTLYVIQESTNEKISCTYSYPDDSTVIIKAKKDLIAGEKYTVVVTNEIKNKQKSKNIKLAASKSFNVKEALEIKEVYELDAITVNKGEKVNLPERVKVVYSDDSTGYVDVTWGSVSTSNTGTKTVTGKIKNSDLKPVIKVEVENDDESNDEDIKEKHIYDVDMEYYSYLGIYKVKVKTSSQVFNVYIGNTKLDYEGDGVYTTTIALKKGDVAKISAYDYDKTLLDTKDQTIK